ncbi:MAG: hypothetical protein ABWK53_04840 [Anaerolineales bacterium]
MTYPHYSYPPANLFGLAGRVFFGGRRAFRADSLACIRRLQPPLRLLGQEHIPLAGPALITFNHYYRPGFRAWWMALALAAVVRAEIHFIMTGELTFPGRWYAPLGQTASRLLLRRLAQVYGFTLMPPMPPRPWEVEGRARAVRAALAYRRSHPQAILGLAPEGGDNPPDGALAWPPPGAGRFVALLAGEYPITPVGIYESEAALCLHFGQAYTLSLPPGLTAEQKDRLAAESVMRAIARLLPDYLRGDFA